MLHSSTVQTLFPTRCVRISLLLHRLTTARTRTCASQMWFKSAGKGHAARSNSSGACLLQAVLQVQHPHVIDVSDCTVGRLDKFWHASCVQSHAVLPPLSIWQGAYASWQSGGCALHVAAASLSADQARSLIWPVKVTWQALPYFMCALACVRRRSGSIVEDVLSTSLLTVCIKYGWC